MAEKDFGRLDALKRTAGNFAKFAGAILTGQAVMVPVHSRIYSEKVEPLRGEQSMRDGFYVGWISDFQVATAALSGSDLSIDNAPSLQMDEVDYARFEGGDRPEVVRPTGNS